MKQRKQNSMKVNAHKELIEEVQTFDTTMYVMVSIPG
jgi:hypothetical protein